MFAKSKKFAIPLVTLLVACIAVEADVSLPERCECKASYNLLLNGDLVEKSSDETKLACAKVGQANGAVFNGTTSKCDIGAQSGYNSFLVECNNRVLMDPLGDLHNGRPWCYHDIPNLPPPQACTCPDPTGVNDFATTNYTCTGLIGNMGTMIDDKCVLPTQGQYYYFDTFCTNVAHSTAKCSDW